MDDAFIYYGSTIKALGNGKVAGHLVLFSTAEDPDLTGEFFTQDTDFDFEDGDRTTVLYNHGLDATIGKKSIGKGTMKKDDLGVWVEAQLNMRDDYEKAIYALAEQGKLGWSSGSLSHRVEYEDKGKATWIKSWALGLDASLTPTPAEPRTKAVPLKSLVEDQGQTLKGHTEAILGDLTKYVARIKDYASMKVAEDRQVSKARRDQFIEIKGLIDEVICLSTKTDPSIVAMKLRVMKEKLLKQH